MEDKSKKEIVVENAINSGLPRSEETILVIREDNALVVHEEIPTNISGILDSPARWLSKRHSQHESLAALVIVDRENMTIALITEERSHFRNLIIGKLEYHPAFIKFKINAGEYITTHEMADKIKMNRSFFESKSDAMALVSTLKGFKAKIDTEIEKRNDNRGNIKAFVQQTVSSNLPESFKMVLPIFKGQQKKTIEVEVYIEPDEFKCTLISPEANEEMELLRDSAINAVLADISMVDPNIVIIEK